MPGDSWQCGLRRLGLVLVVLAFVGCGAGDDESDAATADSSVSSDDAGGAAVTAGAPCELSSDTCEAVGLSCVGGQGACPSYCSVSCGDGECPPELPRCDATFGFCRPAPCDAETPCAVAGLSCVEDARTGLGFCVPDRECL